MGTCNKNVILVRLFGVTLYPADSRVGRERRHSVPHVLPNSGGIVC